MSLVTLHVVSFVQPDKVVHWTIEYEQKAKTLIAVEKNDERAAPYGLRRVRVAELPKVGGLLGTAAVALTEAESRAVVLRVLEARLAKTKQDLMCWETGIKLLKSSP
jgi:hypothetical protein